MYRFLKKATSALTVAAMVFSAWQAPVVARAADAEVVANIGQADFDGRVGGDNGVYVASSSALRLIIGEQNISGIIAVKSDVLSLTIEKGAGHVVKGGGGPVLNVEPGGGALNLTLNGVTLDGDAIADNVVNAGRDINLLIQDTVILDGSKNFSAINAANGKNLSIEVAAGSSFEAMGGARTESGEPAIHAEGDFRLSGGGHAEFLGGNAPPLGGQRGGAGVFAHGNVLIEGNGGHVFKGGDGPEPADGLASFGNVKITGGTNNFDGGNGGSGGSGLHIMYDFGPGANPSNIEDSKRGTGGSLAIEGGVNYFHGGNGDARNPGHGAVIDNGHANVSNNGRSYFFGHDFNGTDKGSASDFRGHGGNGLIALWLDLSGMNGGTFWAHGGKNDVSKPEGVNEFNQALEFIEYEKWRNAWDGDPAQPPIKHKAGLASNNGSGPYIFGQPVFLFSPVEISAPGSEYNLASPGDFNVAVSGVYAKNDNGLDSDARVMFRFLRNAADPNSWTVWSGDIPITGGAANVRDYFSRSGQYELAAVQTLNGDQSAKAYSNAAPVNVTFTAGQPSGDEAPWASEATSMLNKAYNIDWFRAGNEPLSGSDVNATFFDSVLGYGKSANPSEINGIPRSHIIPDPSKGLTRAEACAAIAAILRLPIADFAGFEDCESLSPLHRGAIGALKNIGAVGGMPDGGFHPNDIADKATFATILYRALRLTGGAENRADGFGRYGGFEELYFNIRGGQYEDPYWENHWKNDWPTAKAAILNEWAKLLNDSAKDSGLSLAGGPFTVDPSNVPDDYLNAMVWVVNAYRGKLPEENRGLFSDVDPSQWFYEGVMFLAYRNLVGGTGNGQFGLDMKFDLATTAAMVQRVLLSSAKPGDPLMEYVSPTDQQLRETFSNFDSMPHWGWSPVYWALKHGFVSYDDPSAKFFDINKDVTREVSVYYATMCYPSYDEGKVNLEILNRFADKGTVGGKYKPAMAYMVLAGILNGGINENGDRTLMPGVLVDRPMMGVIFARIVQGLDTTKMGDYAKSLEYAKNGGQ